MTTQRGRRARSQEAKDDRRASIISAARHMLEQRGVEAFTMTAFAHEAQLAKGTSYLYFPTREALYLAILIEDLHVFFDQIAQRLDALPSGDRDRAVATVIADALLGAPLLLPLLRILHTQIERNVPEPALAEFKAFLLDRLSAAGSRLEEKAGVAAGSGLILFLRAHALAVGLSQMADPSPSLDRVYRAHPELMVLAIDFREQFAEALADQIAAKSRRVAPS